MDEDLVVRSSAWSSAPDPLHPFIEAGVLEQVDVHLVGRVSRLAPDATALELLALGLASRATRNGHVCVDLDQIGGLVDRESGDRGAAEGLDWPTGDRWEQVLATSDLVTLEDAAAPERLRPLVLHGRRLYLQRYWAHELEVTRQLTERSQSSGAPFGGVPLLEGDVDEVLGALFADGDADASGPDLQRRAAERAIRHRISVVAGGPGTGKTHTVARILAAAQLLAGRGGGEVRIALAAPTGKAAMRMRTAVVARVEAMLAEGLVDTDLAARLVATEPGTLHRLLMGPGRGRRGDDGTTFLPVDLVIVDETSMVALPLMARLLDALRPDARLVLVGDPDQLASIEAGTVMSDVVGPDTRDAGPPGAPLHGRVTELTARHRFAEDSEIAELAEAVRRGDLPAAFDVLRRPEGEVSWVRPDDEAALDMLRAEVTTSALAVAAAAAVDPEAALDEAERIKVLAATRFGAFGRFAWSDRVERVVAAAFADAPRVGGVRLGTPVIVTSNDRANRLFNGDTGVVVQRPEGLRVAVPSAEGTRFLPLSRLGTWETWWAMTIHKSQGSEFSHAVVSLPEHGSRILTRELLYTAVTRGKDRVTLVGGEDAIVEAIARPVARASGLRDRLWPDA